jgi:hypothetical protein
MIDLGSMKHGDIPTAPNPELDPKLLVNTDNATVAIQSGNVAKHINAKTDEIQYIIEGGSMWLGTERKEFKPGTLIVIRARRPLDRSSLAAPSRQLRSRSLHNPATILCSSIEPCDA